MLDAPYNDIPKLGFGLMRLPEFEGDEGEKVVDIEQVKQMVDVFIDAGLTYFDTAPCYLGGRSEKAVKEALSDRYPRESFQLATKLPAWAAKSQEEAEAMFDESLEAMGTEYFDFYLLHNLGEERTRLFENWDLWNFVAKKKKEGLIRNLGFSMHDKASVLRDILEKHADVVDFVQLQINYADWENDAVESRKCYEVAREYDLPIVVMEPIKGGSLVKLPEAAEEVLVNADPSAPISSWALRFAASLPGVLTVLSGMSTLEQMEQNVSFMKDFRPMSDDELAVVDRVRAILDGLDTVPCTDCRYCLNSCPQHIRIPAALASLNILAMYGDEYRAHENYEWNASLGPASKCIGCGICESVCPQHIDVIAQLSRAAQLFENAD